MSDRTEETIKQDIETFEKGMLEKLHENSHKGYWGGMTLLELLRGLTGTKEKVGEIDELTDAILYESLEAIKREAADVGNFAMFIYTNADRMQKEKQACNS